LSSFIFIFFSFQPKSTKSGEKKVLLSLVRLQPCRHSNTHWVKWIDVLTHPVLPKCPWPQRQPVWIGILCWRDWTGYLWATLSALFLLLLSFYSLIVHVLIYNNQAPSLRWCTLTPAGLASRSGARWLHRTVHGQVWCNWGWTKYFTRVKSHEERSSKWPDTQNTFTAPIKHSNGEKITPSMRGIEITDTVRKSQIITFNQPHKWFSIQFYHYFLNLRCTGTRNQECMKIFLHWSFHSTTTTVKLHIKCIIVHTYTVYMQKRNHT